MIWKTPDIKPDRDEPVLFLAGVGRVPQKGWYYKKTDCFGNRASKNVHKWAYFDEWLADICITERLQAKLRTIANMEQRLCIDDPVDILDDILQIAKDEIKQ